MNKLLFWSGMGFQILQFLVLGLIFLATIEWNVALVMVIGWIVLNLLSVVFLIIGAASK
jgi:hypothetical protein